MTQLLALILHLSSLVVVDAPPPSAVMTTRATRYADTPRDEGGTPRCRYELPSDVFRLLLPVRVASRTIPCGTLLVVEAEDGRRTLVAVLDRGPWGRVALAPGSRAGSPRSRPGDQTRIAAATGHPQPALGPFRGDLDVSPLPADAIGLSLRVGRLRVRYWRAAWQPFAVPERRGVGTARLTTRRRSL